MTTNELIAVCFPLLALVGPVFVGLWLVKPWSKSKPEVSGPSSDHGVGLKPVGAAEHRDAEIRQTLREAEALIRKAERQLSQAGTH